MSTRRARGSSNSSNGERRTNTFRRTYSSLIESFRMALSGFSTSKQSPRTVDGQLTDKMQVTRISHNPATPLSQLPGTLPHSVINENVDPLPIVQAALVRLRMMDPALLTEDTLWRDIFAFTGTTRTFNGVSRIRSTWKELTALHQPYGFKIAPQGGFSVVRAMPTLSWIQVKFFFRTLGSPNLTCTGLMRLIPGKDEDWKIWLLTTILQGIDGFPNVDILEPAMDWQADRPPTPLSDAGESEIENCVIIGAGMSGLCLAGYMKAVGCPAIVLERKDSIGQTWEERYDSVSIHTSRACGQLPFENVWGPEYPYHLGVKDLVEGYNKWVKRYLPNEIWLSTELMKAYWNDKDCNWTLSIRRHGADCVIKTKHLVFALGLCSLKYMPEFPNRETYNGVVLHGSEYKNAQQWKGLKGVIVGAANTGHDCAGDMLKAGLSSVTIVQRGATPVLPVEYYSRIYDPVYNDDIPTQVSDMIMASTPNAITRLMAMRGISKMMSAEPGRFEALEKRGFRTVKADNFDLYHCLLERFGSHYIDVGVSKKIADGLIKVKSDALVAGFSEKGLTFSDGSDLEADVIVFATGYEGNMKLLVAPMLEERVVSKLHDYWNVDDEGEIRGAWKPIGHPNIWYTGGNVLYMRYFARFLAMSLAADIKQCPLTVYEKDY